MYYLYFPSREKGEYDESHEKSRVASALGIPVEEVELLQAIENWPKKVTVITYDTVSFEEIQWIIQYARCRVLVMSRPITTGTGESYVVKSVFEVKTRLFRKTFSVKSYKFSHFFPNVRWLG
ncbi:hypothetical protein IID24_04535 [Patescibacteria group bacterium]|nr:hypothetical protein [Patescibacteria group bacterium]